MLPFTGKRVVSCLPIIQGTVNEPSSIWHFFIRLHEADVCNCNCIRYEISIFNCFLSIYFPLTLTHIVLLSIFTSYSLLWLFYSQNNESALFVLIYIYLSPFDYIEITTLLVWVSPKDFIHTVFEISMKNYIRKAIFIKIGVNVWNWEIIIIKTCLLGANIQQWLLSVTVNHIYFSHSLVVTR